MKILLLCHRFPYPPNKGDKIRSFQLIRRLSKRHELHLLSLADPGNPGASNQTLLEYCSRVEVFPLNRLKAGLRCVVGALGSKPLTIAYFRSKGLATRVRELSDREGYDALVVCGSAMAQYVDLIPRRIPRLIDMVDVDSAKWLQFSRFASFPRSLLWRLEAGRLARYEASLKDRFERIVLTTAQEVDLFRVVSGGGEAVAIRVGVDPAEIEMSISAESATPTIVFTGQMDYFANIDGVLHFTTKVFPRLRIEVPDLRFLIVGRAPCAEVTRLSEIPGVTVTGEVDDVRPYLEEAWAFVAPLRIAQGVQIKVLQAMAMGVPTVVSERVMDGLADGGFEASRDLFVAQNDRQTGDALLNLLRHRTKRLEMAVAAQATLKAQYSWQNNMAKLEEHLNAIAGVDPDRSPDTGRPSLIAYTR